MAHPKNEPIGKPRPNIANLLRVAKNYKLADGSTLEDPKFVLVDENAGAGRLDKPIVPKLQDFTRDELIMLIGLAYPEFADLAKELGDARANYLAAANGIRQVFSTIFHRDPGENWLDNLGDYISKLKQCTDVLRTIATDRHRTVEQLRFNAQLFLEQLDKLEQTKNIVLVDEKKFDAKPSRNSRPSKDGRK